MSGWFLLDIVESRDLRTLANSTSRIRVNCGWTPETWKTPIKKGISVRWDTKATVRTTAASGKVTLELLNLDELVAGMRQVGLAKRETIGSLTFDVGMNPSLYLLHLCLSPDKGSRLVIWDVNLGRDSRFGERDASAGEGWFTFHSSRPELSKKPLIEMGSVFLRWRYTYIPLGHLLLPTDETVEPPAPPAKYSQSQLQAEVSRLTGHLYACAKPYWWLNDRWCWTRPYESAFVMSVGCVVFYYNVLHVAFPALLLLIMVNNYYTRVRYGPVSNPPPASLGLTGTVVWYKKTLELTQNSLTNTCDWADSIADMFLWENQDAATGLLQGFAACFALSATGYFPWHLFLLLGWIWMFTYFPLSFYAPQLYAALSPVSLASWVVSRVFKKDASLSPDDSEAYRNPAATKPLPIDHVRIPQQKKQDGAVRFEVKTTFTDGTVVVVWHRYSEDPDAAAAVAVSTELPWVGPCVI
eukprot:gene19498-30049_t